MQQTGSAGCARLNSFEFGPVTDFSSGISKFQTGLAFRAVKAFVILTFALIANAQTPVGTILTNAAQIRALSPSSAETKIPVTLTSIVTFYNPNWGGFAVQDESSAVWVVGISKKPLSPGDRVQIRGATASGLFTPVVLAAFIEVTGHGSVPSGVEIDWNELFAGKWDVYRIRIRGVAEQVMSSDGETVFQLYNDGRVIAVHLENAALVGLQNHSKVEVSGVCMVTAEDRRLQAIALRVTSSEDIHVLGRYPFSLADLPVVPLAGFSNRGWPRDSGPLFHLRAVVTSFYSNKSYTLGEGTHGVLVIPAETTRLNPGDLMDVLAVPRLGASGVELVELEARVSGHGAVPEPTPVAAREAEQGDRNWTTVEIPGKVLGNMSIDGRQMLLLRDGTVEFLAVSANGRPGRFVRADPGDQVSVKGILRPVVPTSGGNVAFEVAVRSPEDCVVLRRPDTGTGTLLWVVVVASCAGVGLAIWAAVVKKRAEKLQSTELQVQRQQIHFQRTPLGVIEWDTDFRIVSWNPAAERIFGWKASEVIGQHASFLLATLDAGRVVVAWSQLLQSRGSGKTATECLTRDGRSISCEWHNTVLVDVAEKPVGLASLVQDITREQNLAEEVRRQAVEHSAVLSSLAEGILLVDRDGMVISANPSATFLLGATQDTLKRINLFEREWEAVERSGAAVAPFRELGRRCFSGGQAVTGFVFRMRTLDSRERWFSMNVTEAESNGARVASRGVFSLADISDSIEAEERRERLEVELSRSQKLEALGTLAGGVAHDFNNLLAMILGHAEVLRFDFPDEHPVSRSAAEIANAAIRGASLVQRILTFSRPQPVSRTPLLLSTLLTEVVSLLRPTLPPQIVVDFRVSPGERPVEADPNQMHQVFVNLCTNAVQAMGETGGRLRILVETGMVRANSAPALAGFIPGPCVVVLVEDTGPGIPPSVLGRIFEPFFTTKAPGKGTGLGLSVVHGILKAHGAAITVRSELGRGTVFELTFKPAQGDVQKFTSPGSNETSPIGRTARVVLLADDEPRVLDACTQMITAAGYKVRSTTKPAEALRWFQSNPDEFEVLVTDLNMPEMNGLALIQAVRRSRQGMPAVLISGLATSLEPGVGECPRQIVVVSKPFSINTLVGAIESAVAHRPGSFRAGN